MFFHGQTIEQDVVLRSETEAFSHHFDITENIVTIDVRSTTGRWNQARQDRPGSTLAGPIASEKGSDHVSIEFHREILQCHFILIVLAQIFDFHSDLSKLNGIFFFFD
jgi:hypothetical protein